MEKQKLNELNFYLDRQLVLDLPASLRNTMKFKGLIPIDSKEVHFCGLISCSDQIAIFLPRNSEIRIDTDKSFIARNLLTSIQRYQSMLNSSKETSDEGQDIIGKKSLSLIVSLLEDYKLNGIYIRRIKKETRNNGNINWNKTICRMQSFTVGNDLFYPETYGRHHRVVSDSEISRIHAQVIRELCEKFGWIVFTEPLSTEQSLHNIPFFHGNDDNKIALLKNELSVTYSDRDIFLLKDLIQYLEMQSGHESNEFVIGIREFHVIWEKMLDTCLLHTVKMNHRLTAPVYKIGDTYHLASARGYRTDTILKNPNKNEYIIIDAKYYGAKNIHTAPGLADIIKQFYYAKSVKNIDLKSGEARNVFIFPGENGAIQSIHMAPKGKKGDYSLSDCLDDRYPPIICMYQDPIELLEYYSSVKKIIKLSEKILKLSDI